MKPAHSLPWSQEPTPGACIRPDESIQKDDMYEYIIWTTFKPPLELLHYMQWSEFLD